MNPTREEAIYILAENGWLSMTESDAIYILVRNGIRPSSLGDDLNDIIGTAKVILAQSIRMAS